MGREIISLNVGQAGCQLGNAVLDLMCQEHKIDNNGMGGNVGDPSPLFQELSSGRHVPRSLYVDLEPTVVDQVRTGEKSKMIPPSQLISGKEDAANNFARGHYTTGRDMIDPIIDRIRKMVEASDSLQGFMMFHSVGGGTGSGLGALMLERMSCDFGKKTKLDFCVYPSPKQASSVVEPYNAVLSTHALLNLTDASFLVDNEALYDICSVSKGAKPSYSDLNNVVAQVSSSLSSSLRFSGSLNVDLAEIHTNIVPYPRIHFLMSSYAPLTSPDQAYHDANTVDQITKQAFQKSSMLAKCDPRHGKYIACCMMYRGAVNPKDVTAAIGGVKNDRSVQFVDFSPTGFKCGLNPCKPCVVPGGNLAAVDRAVCMIANTTSIGEVFSRMDSKFDMMYAKRCFVHWYVGEGMEESELHEAREDLAALEADYQELSKEDYEEEEEDDDTCEPEF